MHKRPIRAIATIGAALLPFVAALIATSAQAVPSFARQTGADCASCHVGAFGPQLTPFGIKFKLGGYVDSDGKDGKIPLSGMIVLDRTRFKNGDGNKETRADMAEASIFLAGKLADHVGSFVQVTNNGVTRETSIDQADVRYANTVDMSGNEAIVGVSVNNNPTVQDPFNTLTVWSFPYTGSERLAGTGTELVSGSGEQRVMGVNAYTFINNSIYGELGVYNTISPAMQSRLGLTEAGGQDLGRMGNAPYWRLGYMQDLRTRAWSVGLLGFNGTFKDGAEGDNKFKDFGVDASYQFLGTREHVVTVNGRYVREHHTATDLVGEESSDTTKDWRVATSYHYMNTYGATLGYFKANSKEKESGNRGFIYQVDWTPFGKESSWGAPWANLRLGAQYIAFKSYIDAETHTALDKPGDKNSMRVFLWTSY